MIVYEFNLSPQDDQGQSVGFFFCYLEISSFVFRHAFNLDANIFRVLRPHLNYAHECEKGGEKKNELYVFGPHQAGGILKRNKMSPAILDMWMRKTRTYHRIVLRHRFRKAPFSNVFFLSTTRKRKAHVFKFL